MNNKVRFDEILHVYTVSQAARPFLFIVTFKDFFSSNDKGNMYLMQKKKKSSKGTCSIGVELKAEKAPR